MKHATSVLAVLGLLVLTAACGTLAPGGAYKDKVLYETDLAITTAYDVVHTFVKWEYDNRAALKAVPQITLAADNIRGNARMWFSSAIALRETYAANPTSDNLSKLKTALAILQTAMNEATKYLVETTTSTPITP